jgi:glycosyltransferase involved in cell wall biosynthesis/SAM-dependent methyltransferase
MVADVGASSVTGGAERVLWEQASRLARRGHEVRVVSRAHRGQTPTRQCRDGVWVGEYGVDHTSAVAFIRDALVAARRAVVRELAEGAVDVLHLHQPLAGYAALTMAAARRLPTVYTFHSAAPLEYHSRVGMTARHRRGAPGAAVAAALWAIERACLRHADRIHVLSAFSADHLWRLYRIPGERIVRIPGGVDTERFRPAPDRRAARKELGLPGDRPLLLTVRNLEARMGIDNLVRAMALLRAHVRDAVLLIGGTGSLRRPLEALVASLGLEDDVQFLGFVPEADLPRYYQAADAFVLPTRALEGFGLVTAEALASGTPVLGTPIGATPELLRPLSPRLVFDDASPEAMARGLREFLEADARDPGAAAALRDACRRHAETRYAWDVAVSGLERLLREVRNRGPEPAVAAPCPACGGATGATRLLYRGARYRRCHRCRIAVAAALPTRAELHEHYETEYPARFGHRRVDGARAALFESVLATLEGWCPRGRLLDVGASGGHFVAAARGRGWKGVATDLSSDACRAARASYGVPAVRADSVELPVAAASVDAVTVVNVIDQIADPLALLREAHRVLRPGGVLVVRVPNGAFHVPCVRVLSSLGPFPRWRGWDAYPILHFFTLGGRGLRLLVERAGFRVLETRNSSQAALGDTGGRRRSAALLGVVTAALATLSRRRWLAAPSIEVYAEKPPR